MFALGFGVNSIFENLSGVRFASAFLNRDKTNFVSVDEPLYILSCFTASPLPRTI
jgi:hypothetical protein